MTIDKQDITHDDLHFHLVRPEKGNGAGLLILPTMYGLGPDRFTNETNTTIYDFAARFGEQGYTVLLWDCYAGARPTADREGARAMGDRLRDDWVMQQMTGCISYLRQSLGIQRIGALGYCIGGRYIFLLGARDRRVSACAAIYPSVHVNNAPNQDDDAVALAGAMECPVLLFYPGQDEVTKRVTFQALQGALQSRSTAPTTSVLYPEADHGFFSRPGVANVSAAGAGWPVLDGFLKAHLG